MEILLVITLNFNSFLMQSKFLIINTEISTNYYFITNNKRLIKLLIKTVKGKICAIILSDGLPVHGQFK